MSPQSTIGLPAAELSPAKRALLEARLRGRHHASGIARRTHNGTAQPSFAQERLWVLERMGLAGTAYNICVPFRLDGVLDLPALERAMGEIVRRHEVLRTSFADSKGFPLQVIAPFSHFVLSVEDISGWDEATRDAEAQRRSKAEAARPFDLSRGPLFRTTLLRLGHEEHLLVLCLHHIITDGWSMRILFRELRTLYDAYREGRESPLAEPTLQYADYALWQRELFQDDVLNQQLAWWRDRLADAPELIPLPTDHPRPAVQTFHGAHEPLQLPVTLLEQLQALAHREGCTLYIVLLGVFQVLLSIYTGSKDIVVGSPIAGRTHKELEDVLGFFVNMLVLRANLSGDPSFREVLRRVREMVLGAYEHQDVPFERLVAELRPGRSLSYAPLFQVALTMNEAGRSRTPLSGIHVRHVDTEVDSVKTDLALDLTATPSGLIGGLFYSTDLFQRSTIRRMLGLLRRLLEQIAANSDVRLSKLELLDEDEARLVKEWSGAERPYVARPIQDLFGEQAARTPDAVALRFGDDGMTYRQLETSANRLAHYLARQGAAPEKVVGVIAERTPETVVALLAILKAGAAYLPLDPTYPTERLRHMLDDSGARLIVSPGSVPDWLTANSVLPVVDIGAEASRIRVCPELAVRVPVDPDNLAYIVYTSGSTGRPKGVAVPHRGVPNLVAWKQSRLGQRASDRALQFAALSFDAAVEELFGALLIGGTLIIPTPEARMPGKLQETLIRERVSFATLAPSVLASMESHDFPDLRVLVCAGESLPAAVAARWAGVVELHNAYGPTEATVSAASGRVAADGEVPNIGCPLDNVRAYVLDAVGRLVPVGVPGELYLGGEGIARGYLHRRALTAERFVPSPFGDCSGARLFRTGDHVRWRPNGSLDFLGRFDDQVKIRGFRIEPGEVERVLATYAGVRDVRVIVREDRPGDKQLVAYIVGDADADGLRQRLRQVLPEYLVPSAIVPLDAFPLTSAGKVDRKALPPPKFGLATHQVDPPRNFIEVQLIHIWEELLGAEHVGASQSFFDLGGNSLLAVALLAQIKEKLQIDLPVATLFLGATVRGIATAILEQRKSVSLPRTSVVPLQPNGTLPPLFCVHPAGREVHGYVNTVRHLGANQPAFGIVDLGDLARPLAQIALEHVRDIRSVQPDGPYYLLGWSFGGSIAYEMAIQLEREGQTVAFLGLMDTMEPVLWHERPEMGDRDVVIGLASDVAAQMGRPFSLSRDELDGLEPNELCQRLAEALHAQGAAPRHIGAAWLLEGYHAVRARRRSEEGYVPGRLSGTLTLFKASEVPEESVRFFAPFSEEEQRTYCWCRLTQTRVEVHSIPGTHVTMGSEPNVRVLAHHLRAALAAARLPDGAVVASRASVLEESR